MSGVHPDNTPAPSNTSTAAHPAPLHKDATAAHPPASKPDPTLTGSGHAAQGAVAAAGAPAAAELAKAAPLTCPG